MAIKHRVLKDFQLVTEDKKIIILKSKTILEDYKYTNKKESAYVSKEIIQNNPEFFLKVEWTEELNNYLKLNKIAQPAVVTKKLVPFIEKMMSEIDVKTNVETVIVESVKHDYDIQLELESKLKKVTLKESRLEKESDDLNIREAEINLKEKKTNKLDEDLKSKEKELQDRENLLNIKSSELESKIISINEKYIERLKLDERFSEVRRKYGDRQLTFDILDNFIGI